MPRPTPRPATASRSAKARPYDVVLLGATGFAGRLTAAYLAAHRPDGLSWAIAGRSRAKLESVAADLGDVGIVVADTGDETQLRDLAESTRVLITTVGPYVLYGDGVVAACAAAGTDYLDLTGEPEFVDLSYVRHHRTALESGARLVHAAGFDSIPHDTGAWFTVQQLPADVPVTMSGYVRAHAAFSGGTFHSAITGLSRARSNMAAARDRKGLEPRSERSARGVLGRPHRDPVDRRWSVPLPLLDVQVITRSARAVPRYGPDFRYSHFASVGHLGTVVGGALGIGAVAGLAQIPFTRRLMLDRIKAGDGPSPERRARSWFTVTFVAEGGGERVVTRVSGGDPGYDETAKMLAESALCLACDELPQTAGQVTTVTAMGDHLLDRLRAAGIGYAVLESSA